MRIVPICLALVIAFPVFAGAQSSGSLLPEGSKAGQRLTVTTASGARLSGRLVADDRGSLVLRSDSRERTIAHSEVARVDRRHNRFIFGPLIGLGGGLAAGLPLKRRFDNEGGDGNAWLGLMVGLGVGVGSVIDLFNGSERTIYTRSPGSSTSIHVVPTRSGVAVRVRLAVRP
jgi:hypothetical protein